MFSIAAAFVSHNNSLSIIGSSKISDELVESQGNVHGVYKPGNVILRPELLGKHQAYCKEQLKTDDPRPLYLVFHGGSGSSKDEIALALKFGVVKVSCCAHSVEFDLHWLNGLELLL